MTLPLDIVDWDLRWERWRVPPPATATYFCGIHSGVDRNCPQSGRGEEGPQMGDHEKSLDWLNEIAPLMSKCVQPSPGGYGTGEHEAQIF
jgi:hypothetical protein